MLSGTLIRGCPGNGNILDNNRLRLRLGSAGQEWPLFRREQSVMVQTTTGGFIRLADVGENQENGWNLHIAVIRSLVP